MNKQAVLRIGKVEDIRRDEMYRDYLLLLAEKKKARGKIDSAVRNRLALK
ncbi:hypothetical protein [Desulfotruncus alcoholivorax]|nr:hypothetical protein [Desulfotruncus alcoholivorax]